MHATLLGWLQYQEQTKVGYPWWASGDHHWYDDQPIRETPGQKVTQLFAQRNLCLFNTDEKLIICCLLKNLAFYVPMTFLISDVGLTDACNFAWLVIIPRSNKSWTPMVSLCGSPLVWWPTHQRNPRPVVDAALCPTKFMPQLFAQWNLFLLQLWSWVKPPECVVGHVTGRLCIDLGRVLSMYMGVVYFFHCANGGADREQTGMH